MCVAAERHAFPSAVRLTRKSEYQQVFTRGKKCWGSAFICFVLADPAHETRLGAVVSRKVGGAVVRNRVKRCIREFFRLNRTRFEPGLQLVVVARAVSARLDGRACARELEHMLRKHLLDA